MCSPSLPAPLHHANRQNSVHQSPTQTHQHWEHSPRISAIVARNGTTANFAKNYFALTFRSPYHKKSAPKSSISEPERQIEETHTDRDRRKRRQRGLTELQPLRMEQRHSECRQPDAVCLASPQPGGSVQQPRLLADAAAAAEQRHPRHRLP